MLPWWHVICSSLGVSALLFGLPDGLFHKGCLSGSVLWVVHALLTLHPGKAFFVLGVRKMRVVWGDD